MKNNTSDKKTTCTLESIIQKSLESPIAKVDRKNFLRASLISVTLTYHSFEKCAKNLEKNLAP